MKNKVSANKNKKLQTTKTTQTLNFSVDKIPHKLFILISTLILYGWTYTFNFSLDDNYVLSALNEVENNLSGLTEIFYQPFAVTDFRPVSVLTFWLERNIFGSINPNISHLLNVLLFAWLLTVIYDFVIVSKFYADEHKLKILAFITVFIFLIHPNHVSVVANIKSRDSILSMLFGLLGTIQFLKLMDDKKVWRIILVILFLTAGFLSKMDSYIFIVTPLLLSILYKQLPIKKIVFTVVFTYIVYILVIGFRSSFMETINESNQLNSILFDASRSPLVENDSFLNRISLAFTSLFYYIKFLIVPFGYYFYFGYNQIPLLPVFHPLNILVAFILMALTFLSIRTFKKNKIYFFSFIFFLAAIAYASNIPVIIAGIVMDRYNFIPSLGFCLAMAALCIDYGNAISIKSFISNKWFIGISIILIVATVYRTSAWKDTLTLYNRDIAHLEKSVHANRLISVAYINKTLFEETDNAIKDENMRKAELYIDRALAVSKKSPDVFEAKGICELYKGNNRNALLNFETSKSLDSNYLSAINYIGVAYRNLAITDSAYYYFNYVMQRESNYNYSAGNLLELLVKNNRFREADSLKNILLSKYPDNQMLLNKLQELNR